jgi:hypothetical protein
MASGAGVEDIAVEAFKKVKQNKTKCCVFVFTDNKKNVTVKENSEIPKKRNNPEPADFQTFMDNFEAKKCAFGVYSAQFVCEDSSGNEINQDKLIFVSWADDCAKVTDKFLHGSTKQTVKQKIDFEGQEFHLTEESEKEPSYFIEKLQDIAAVKIAGTIKSFEGQSVDDW